MGILKAATSSRLAPICFRGDCDLLHQLLESSHIACRLCFHEVATFSNTTATIYLFLGMSFGGTFFKGNNYYLSGSSMGILKVATICECNLIYFRGACDLLHQWLDSSHIACRLCFHEVANVSNTTATLYLVLRWAFLKRRQVVNWLPFAFEALAIFFISCWNPAMSSVDFLSRSGTFFEGDSYDISGSSMGILQAATSREWDPIYFRLVCNLFYQLL
jgi:hypothetical protein